MKLVPQCCSLVVGAGLFLLAILFNPAEGAGPWKAQIVDGETGQPLSNVIVFAVWWKRFPGLIREGHAFHRSAETVSGTNGQIELPAMSTLTLIPFGRIQGPDLTIFHSGYGRWRFRGEPAQFGPEYDKFMEQAWRRLANEGIVIELPRTRTTDERLSVAAAAGPYHEIPPTEGTRLRQALDAELKEIVQLKSEGR